MAPVNSPTDRTAADLVTEFVAAAMERQGTVIIGLCGAQGSGKSTVAAAVSARLTARGVGVATLGLDDLYLPREHRERLARDVHPLLQTRGVPGTHDAELGVRILHGLCDSGTTLIPHFDKAQDTRTPQDRWAAVQGPVRVVLFEGWCVGARAQARDELAAPVNALERDEDSAGVWRSFANDALAGPYQTLFARIDRLILLAAPSFDVVAQWRRQQEHDLRAALMAERRGLERTMDDAAIARFVRHYERLTRHILAEMPHRADLTIRLDEARRVVR